MTKKKMKKIRILMLKLCLLKGRALFRNQIQSWRMIQKPKGNCKLKKRKQKLVGRVKKLKRNLNKAIEEEVGGNRTLKTKICIVHQIEEVMSILGKKVINISVKVNEIRMESEFKITTGEVIKDNRKNLKRLIVVAEEETIEITKMVKTLEEEVNETTMRPKEINVVEDREKMQNEASTRIKIITKEVVEKEKMVKEVMKQTEIKTKGVVVRKKILKEEEEAVGREEART